jgi:transcriptional regulator with XRE-family HTH domain
MTIGNLLKSARERLGISQAELARSIGTSQQNIGRIENGDVWNSSFLPAVIDYLRSVSSLPNPELDTLRQEVGSQLEDMARHTAIELEALPEEVRDPAIKTFLVTLNPTRSEDSWTEEELKTFQDNIQTNMGLGRKFQQYVRRLSEQKERGKRRSLRLSEAEVNDLISGKTVDIPMHRAMVEPGPDARIGERVRWERTRRQMSQANLADLAGCHQADIYRIENGQVEYSKYMQRVLDVLEMGLAPHPNVPVVGYVGAGAEIHPIDDHTQGDGLDTIPAPPGLVKGIALIVRGDSMWPRYSDGDIVVFEQKDIQQTVEALAGRTCYVKLNDGRALLKILQKGTTPGMWTLLSHNAPPIENVGISSAFPVAWVKPKG